MGFFKRLFGFEKEEEKKDEKECDNQQMESCDGNTQVGLLDSSSSVPSVDTPNKDNEVCDHCGFEITSQQRSIHKFGKTYHVKPCWREVYKGAKKEMFG